MRPSAAPRGPNEGPQLRQIHRPEGRRRWSGPRGRFRAAGRPYLGHHAPLTTAHRPTSRYRPPPRRAARAPRPGREATSRPKHVPPSLAASAPASRPTRSSLAAVLTATIPLVFYLRRWRRARRPHRPRPTGYEPDGRILETNQCRPPEASLIPSTPPLHYPVNPTTDSKKPANPRYPNIPPALPSRSLTHPTPSWVR